MKQKEIFLQGEGDAWLARNAAALAARPLPEGDSLIQEVLNLGDPGVLAGTRVLEAGCGDGSRLAWLQDHLGCVCHGVDPSAKAVEAARSRGVEATVGTADSLPHPALSFDIVIFGFCLYLVDRDDLFRVAAEADRVLKDPGWLMIKDFYSPEPYANAYHHKPGLQSYKMDYRTLFTWNVSYVCFAHRVTHHSDDSFTDDRHEWVSTSVLRKCKPR